MKKTYATILAAVAAATLAAGCEQQQPCPAEKVGKQIDQAVEKAGQKTQAALEKAEQKTAAAAEKVEKYTDEKVKEAGKALEQTGEKLQK
jgi:PBP1b-binding outer membrane lipoprotein LpoB